MSWRFAACLAALTAVHGSGCSWLTVQRPPRGPVEPEPSAACTSSAVAPVVDTVGTILFGASGVLVTGVGAAWGTCGSGGGFLCVSPGEKAAVIGVGLAYVGAATALGFSAASGYASTADCRRLRDAQLACVSGVEDSCRALRERK